MWRTKLWVIAVALVAAPLLSGNASAQDENWTALLAPPADGTSYAANEPLAIRPPDSVPFDNLLRLGLEVDSIDVTPLLAFENRIFTYRPQQPLAPGKHVVRLVENIPGSGVVERGTWTIVVKAGAPSNPALAKQISEFKASAQNAVEISHRLAEHRISNSSRTQIAGGGYGSASYKQDKWSFSGSVNYLAHSEDSQKPNGRSADIGEYNLTGRFDGDDMFGQVALGHQNLGISNFILSGFNRRGLSASVGTADKSIAVTGFGLRTNAITGREDFAGINDSDNLVQGFSAETHPIAAWGKNFALKGIVYTGKGNTGGTGVGGATTVTDEGNGWGVGTEAFLADRRLKLQGQFAHTDFEYGQITVGDDEASGSAWSSGATYNAIRNAKIGGDVVNLNIGAKYERVETFFNSLANPSLAPDRDGILVHSDLSWGGFVSNLQGVYQTNNVDDLAGVPTDSVKSAQLSGNYYPTVTPPAPGEINWLGQPFVNFNIGYTDNQREETPVGYAGANTDNQNRTFTLGGGSNYSNWGWQLAETYSQFDDQTGAAADTRNYLTALSTNWLPSPSTNLSAGVQWNQIIDADNDNNTHNINLNLGIQAELIPKTLRIKANYNLNLLAGDGDSNDRTIANGEVEWTLLPPTVNSVGVAIVFQGLMENKDRNADVNQNQTVWQVFSLLRLSAPLAY